MTNPTRKAVVLLSGGMDSAVTLAKCIEDSYHPCALHINYGQRTEQKELQSFLSLCDHYHLDDRLVSDIKHLVKIGGSSLTDTTMAVTKADLHSQEIPSSYVPFRNANLLSIAVSWAEVIHADAIYIGAVEEDSSGYPDCRASFFRAFEAMVAQGTRPDTAIKIKTPVIHLKKHEIVAEGNRLNVPFEKTWSCYQSEDQACGQCDSCGFRLRGFKLAGLHDPIEYQSRPDY